MGTPSVSEAAAFLSANGGKLLLDKQKGGNYTMAIAIELIAQLHKDAEETEAILLAAKQEKLSRFFSKLTTLISLFSAATSPLISKNISFLLFFDK